MVAETQFITIQKTKKHQNAFIRKLIDKTKLIMEQKKKQDLVVEGRLQELTVQKPL